MYLYAGSVENPRTVFSRVHGDVSSSEQLAANEVHKIKNIHVKIKQGNSNWDGFKLQSMHDDSTRTWFLRKR